jgi:hypothetical protein
MYISPMPPDVGQTNTFAGCENPGRNTASLNLSTCQIDNGRAGQMTSPRGGWRQVSQIVNGASMTGYDGLQTCAMETKAWPILW